jgi:ribosomal protein S21
MKVDVRNNDVVRAYKKIKRKLTDDGVFDIMKDKQYYTKPSAKKRADRKMRDFNVRKRQWDNMVSTGEADRWMKKNKRNNRSRFLTGKL